MVAPKSISGMHRKHSAGMTAVQNTTGDGRVLKVLGVDEGKRAPESGVIFCIPGKLGGDGSDWPLNSGVGELSPTSLWQRFLTQQRQVHIPFPGIRQMTEAIPKVGLYDTFRKTAKQTSTTSIPGITPVNLKALRSRLVQ